MGPLTSAEVLPPISDSPAGDAAAQAASQAKQPLETLSATEFLDTLEAIVARLIPPLDVNGPGATEARAAHYIDRALGGALSSSHAAYAAGLAAVDQYARSAKGASFVKLLHPKIRTPC